MSNMTCHDVRELTPRSCCRLIALLTILGGISTIISPAEAALKHQYNFAEGPTNNASGRTIIDSISGANGTVIGPVGAGMNPTATVHALVLPGGPSAEAPYVDLPNGMISSLTNVTLEGWYSLSTAQNWGRIFDFGSTTGGELTGPGGGGEGLDYIQFAATRGTDQNTQRAGIRNNDPLFNGPAGGTVAAAESLADSNVAYTLGARRQAVVVYNSTGGAGAAPASLTVYVDGVQQATTNTAIQLGNLSDVNNWLGRSNWTGDANLAGTLEEFRIYDHALTAAEVTQRFNQGPVGPVPPTLEVNRDTGAMTLINQTAAVQIVGYTITSPAGSLVQANWRSVTDNYDANSGGSFDPNHAWTELSVAGSKVDFSEFDFSGGSAPFGGALGDGASLTSLQLGAGGAADAQRAGAKQSMRI